MVAVYGRRWWCRATEKSFTTPIFETIMLKSCRSDRLADQVFDLGDIFVRDFDPGAGGSFEVDGELAGIGARERRHRPKKRIDPQAGHEDAHQQQPPSARDASARAHRAFVDIQQPVEPAVEPGVETAAQRSRVVVSSPCRGRVAPPSEIASRTAESPSSRRRTTPAAQGRTPAPGRRTEIC